MAYSENIDQQQQGQVEYVGDEEYDGNEMIYDNTGVYYDGQEDEETYTVPAEHEAAEATQIPDSTSDIGEHMQAMTLNDTKVDDTNDSQATSPPPQPTLTSSETDVELNQSPKSDVVTSTTNTQDAQQPEKEGETQPTSEPSAEPKPSPWGSSNKTWASILFAGSNETSNELNKIITVSEEGGDSSHAATTSTNNATEQKTYISVSNASVRNVVITPPSLVMPLSPRNKFAFDDTSKIEVVPMTDDPMALKLAKRLRDGIHIKHSLPTILPCGLINRGNWCYVNAVCRSLAKRMSFQYF